MDLGSPLATLVGPIDAAVIRVLARTHTHTPLNGRQIHRLAGIGSPAGVNAALARLSRNGLAFATVHSYANLYRINRDHVLWPAVEIALNAPNELRSRIRRFGEQDGPPGVTVLLYGSVERGDATPDSDVDLVVIAPDDTPASEFEDFVYELGNRVRAWTGNQSQVISLTSSQLADSANRGDPLIDTWTSASEVLLGEIKTEAR